MESGLIMNKLSLSGRRVAISSPTAFSSVQCALYACQHILDYASCLAACSIDTVARRCMAVLLGCMVLRCAWQYSLAVRYMVCMAVCCVQCSTFTG